MLASAAPLSRIQPPSASVVVIADVDGILRHGDTRTLAEARPRFGALSGSILVLCSNRSAEQLRALQQQLDIRQPFISDGGAALHIPDGYFCGTATQGGVGGYETIDFGVRRLGHAVRLLVALYRACPMVPTIVGIGFEWRDRVLLREVDVPVVIKNPALDQSSLLRNVPNAYITDSPEDAELTRLVRTHGSVGRA
jgi:predicted mannosyl-3-phosphoglycerate phosphatase (HAD superfamily)